MTTNEAVFTAEEIAHLERIGQAFGDDVIAEGITDPRAFFIRCAELYGAKLESMIREMSHGGDRGQEMSQAIVRGAYDMVNQ